MGQILHGSATTTHAVRALIQRSAASNAALSRELGINIKTVAKWRKRETVEDAAMGPKEARSTVLSVEEEAICVAFRRHTLFMVPSITQGAIRASCVSPAMKVCVPHLPNGAVPYSRSPTGARPRSRVRFVLTACVGKTPHWGLFRSSLPSMKTSLCGSRRMRGWRRMIQS